MFLLCVIAAHVSVPLSFDYYVGELRELLLLCVVVVRERREDNKYQREEGR